jgi:hypothetical protein
VVAEAVVAVAVGFGEGGAVEAGGRLAGWVIGRGARFHLLIPGFPAASTVGRRGISRKRLPQDPDRRNYKVTKLGYPYQK